MKKYLNIIFLAADWESYYRKPFYDEVIKFISQWSDILIVQMPVCLIGHLFTRFKQKIIGLITGKYKTRKIKYGAIVFTPVMFFHYTLWIKYKFTAVIDRYMLKLQLNKFIKKNFPDHIKIIWVYEANYYYLLDKLNYEKLIYDDIFNLNFKSNGTEANEDRLFNEKLIKKSDLVVCTSRELFQQCKDLNPKTLLLSNGNAYNKLTDRTYMDIPNELSNLDKPIIGYLGNIRDWIDFQLLHYLIKQLDDVYFVFISMVSRNVKQDFKNILKYPSVKWISYIEQKYLPGYLKYFSVGIIPFKINDFMKSIFPNKFFEYMALEVPIVTTALPDLKDYSDIIGYSNSDEEFIANCISALEGKYKDKVKLYKKIAEANSWEKRAKTINEKLIQFV